MKTKALFCSYDQPDNIGGPFRWLDRMLPELAERDIEPYCLWMAARYLDLDNPDNFPNATSLSKKGIFSKVIHYPYYAEDQIRTFIEYCNIIKPDIFVPNMCIPAYYAGRWIRSAGIQTIGILRGDYSFYHAICNEFVTKESPYQVSACVSVSRYLQELASAKGQGAVKSLHIPSGSPIPDKKTSAPIDEFRLIYSGRLVQEPKHIEDVTRVLCRVSSLENKIKATICGEGKDRKKVAQIIADESREGSVTLLPPLSLSELQELLLKQHAIILLSEYEGTPTAIMEAMACGVVPICYNIRSGIPDIIEDGVNGILVNDRLESVIAAINKLKENPEFWCRLSENARKTAEDSFAFSRCADRWATLLHELGQSKMKRGAVKQPFIIRLPAENQDMELQFQNLRRPSIFSRVYWKIAGLCQIIVNQLGKMAERT